MELSLLLALACGVFSLALILVLIAVEVPRYRRRKARNQRIRADLLRAGGVDGGFAPTHQVVTDSGMGLLLIDEKARVIKAGHCLPESDGVFMQEIPADGIGSVRVVDNYKSEPFNLKRELRDAVLEGVWYGRVGVLISIVETLFRSTNVRDVSLVIETKDASIPAIALGFLALPADRGDVRYGEARREAARYKQLIEALAHDAARAA